MCTMRFAGGTGAVAGPLLRYASSIGGDATRLGARGILADGELRSAQAQSAPPVWFLFTGARAHGLCCMLPATFCMHPEGH